MPKWKQLMKRLLGANLVFIVFLLFLAVVTVFLDFMEIDLWKIVAGILLSLGLLSFVSTFVASFLAWISHFITWILTNLHLNFLIITPLLFIKKILAYFIYFLGRSSKRISDFLDRMEGKIFAILEINK